MNLKKLSRIADRQEFNLESAMEQAKVSGKSIQRNGKKQITLTYVPEHPDEYKCYPPCYELKVNGRIATYFEDTKEGKDKALSIIKDSSRISDSDERVAVIARAQAISDPVDYLQSHGFPKAHYTEVYDPETGEYLRTTCIDEYDTNTIYGDPEVVFNHWLDDHKQEEEEREEQERRESMEEDTWRKIQEKTDERDDLECDIDQVKEELDDIEEQRQDANDNMEENILQEARRLFEEKHPNEEFDQTSELGHRYIDRVGSNWEPLEGLDEKESELNERLEKLQEKYDKLQADIDDLYKQLP